MQQNFPDLQLSGKLNCTVVKQLEIFCRT